MKPYTVEYQTKAPEAQRWSPVEAFKCQAVDDSDARAQCLAAFPGCAIVGVITARVYGVSFGNGNDGVSQLYPSFYVTTDSPYALALAAVIDQFKPSHYAWAAENIDVDGEAAYGISATIYNPPSEPGDAPEDSDDDESGDNDYCSHNGAWMICEVFQVDPGDVKSDRPFYDSLEEAVSPQALALTAKGLTR